MKNVMKALGMAILVSGVFAVTSVSAQTTPAAKTTTTPAAKTTTAPAKANTDKVVGKDAKGNNIYEGPKGGKYTINAKGAKVYLPKDKTAASTTPAKSTTPKN